MTSRSSSSNDLFLWLGAAACNASVKDALAPASELGCHKTGWSGLDDVATPGWGVNHAKIFSKSCFGRPSSQTVSHDRHGLKATHPMFQQERCMARRSRLPQCLPNFLQPGHLCHWINGLSPSMQPMSAVHETIEWCNETLKIKMHEPLTEKDQSAKQNRQTSQDMQITTQHTKTNNRKPTRAMSPLNASVWDCDRTAHCFGPRSMIWARADTSPG